MTYKTLKELTLDELSKRLQRAYSDRNDLEREIYKREKDACFSETLPENDNFLLYYRFDNYKLRTMPKDEVLKNLEEIKSEGIKVARMREWFQDRFKALGMTEGQAKYFQDCYTSRKYGGWFSEEWEKFGFKIRRVCTVNSDAPIDVVFYKEDKPEYIANWGKKNDQ